MNYKIKYLNIKKQYLLNGGSMKDSSTLSLPLPQLSLPLPQLSLQQLPTLCLEEKIYLSQKNIRMIKSHGVIIGTTFIIPENTYIITINECGTPIPVSELLDQELSSLLETINKEPLFENNNESNIKTQKLIEFEHEINNIFLDRFHSYFSNHLPGSEMSDMILNFITEPCDQILCGIEFFDPTTNNIYHIEPEEILSNLIDKEPKQQFGSPRQKIDNIQEQHFRELINTNAEQQIEINKLTQEIEENESKVELLKEIKVLHEETSQRIEKYKTNKAIDRVINLDDGCVFLQTLIREYGHGIYIIRACRRFNPLISETTRQLLRRKSFDNNSL